MGRCIYATGGNERAAIYSGINTKKWKIVAFAISGTLASISGLIFSSRVESIDPVQGMGYQMFALAIAVVGGVSMEGGRGTLVGTLLATAIVALVFNVMSLFNLYAWYQTMFIGAIIVSAAIQQAYNRKSLV
jgi:ribose/xylose/arabinose/galactoside ABC-type transport system permease subunit